MVKENQLLPPEIQKLCLGLLMEEVGKGIEAKAVIKGICSGGTFSKWQSGALHKMNLYHVEEILRRYGGAMTAEVLMKIVKVFRSRGQVILDLIKIEQSSDQDAIEAVEAAIRSIAKKV